MARNNKEPNIVIDPEFEALIPPLSKEEYAQLKENIFDAQRIYDYIVVWVDPAQWENVPSEQRKPYKEYEHIIIDGHNRWRIMQELRKEHPGFSPYWDYREESFDSRNEAILWIINNQLGRRNLNKADAIMLAKKRGEIVAAEAKAKQSEAGKSFGVGMPKKEEIASVKNDKSYSEPIDTRKEVAKLAGVSTGTVAQFEQVQKKAPELIPKIRKGEMTIGGAYKEVKKKEPEKARPKFTIIRGDSSPYKPKEYSWHNPKADKAEFDKKMKSVVADMETTDKPYGLDDAICELNGAEDVFFTQIRFILEERKDVIASDERGREQIAAFIQSVHRDLDAAFADI